MRWSVWSNYRISKQSWTFDELRSHLVIVGIGLTKCAAHLGKRAAQLANCARVWGRARLAKRARNLPNVAHLVKFRAFDQLVKCAAHLAKCADWSNAPYNNTASLCEMCELQTCVITATPSCSINSFWSFASRMRIRRQTRTRNKFSTGAAPVQTLYTPSKYFNSIMHVNRDYKCDRQTDRRVAACVTYLWASLLVVSVMRTSVKSLQWVWLLKTRCVLYFTLDTQTQTQRERDI